jgi:hypothetical protein
MNLRLFISEILAFEKNKNKFLGLSPIKMSLKHDKNNRNISERLLEMTVKKLHYFSPAFQPLFFTTKKDSKAAEQHHRCRNLGQKVSQKTLEILLSWLSRGRFLTGFRCSSELE